MLKEQKKQVFVFGIVAILGISLTTPVAKGLDIEEISMCSQKDHLDGTAPINPWRFEVDIHLVDPGTLHHIDVTLPTGGMTSFTIYEDSGDWEYHSSPTLYPTLTALQAVYPTGTYTLDFRDSGGGQLNYVQLDYSGLSEPGSPVDFTYPSDNGQTGISTNPTLTWTVNSGAGDAFGMVLYDDYEEIYRNVPPPMETLSWQPGPLDPEQNHWLYVTVVRVKDWAGGPGLPTKTVGGDEFEYILHIGYMNKIGFTTGLLPEEEWPVEGVWISTVPTPLGNMIIKSTWMAQDDAKTRFTGEFEQINTYPVLIDVYPDSEEIKYGGGLMVKIGLNKYDVTFLQYFTKTSGPSLEEIVGIGIVTGTFELVGPDLVQGQGTGAYYMAAQDADQDGFPDEGQEPVVLVPWGWTAKRLTTMSVSVPTP